MTSYVLIHRTTLVDDDRCLALYVMKDLDRVGNHQEGTVIVGCGRSEQCVCHVLATECTLS